MSLPKKLRQISLDFARSLWARLWIRIEARVAPIEGRLALIEGALSVMQRDPAAFFDAKSIGALSISVPAVWQEYRAWIARLDRVRAGEDERIKRHIAGLKSRPKFSVVIPVQQIPFHALQEMIVSLRGQIYENWELYIARAATGEDAVDLLLKRLTVEDARVRAVTSSVDDALTAMDVALESLTGDYVALLDHNDILAPHALAMMTDAINQHAEADIFYSDEDKLDPSGQRYDPWFKPDWNPELLKGQDYVRHLGVFRTALVRGLQGLGREVGEQENGLALRLTAATRKPIVHVPHILCHRRQIIDTGEALSSTRAKSSSDAFGPAFTRGKAVEMKKNGGAGSIVDSAPQPWPRVSAIIPTRDRADLLAICLHGLFELTDYPDLEILIADNDSSQPETLALFAEMEERGVRIVACPGEFNYSKINNEVARHANGEVLLFLNNDVEMVEPGWLKAMVEHLSVPEIAAVGAKLLYPDGTLQHGGVVLGVLGVAAHVHVGAPADSPGYFGRLRLAQDVSCVTGACMAVRRSVFEELGGFEERLMVDFNDVDLCIRIREAGHRIIWTPRALLIHHESKSRGSAKENDNRRRLDHAAAYMRRRWGDLLDRDPFWNPNLSLRSTEPQIAFLPRIARPWL
jgi:GT2 family glycosyltransferase